eukprot:451858-Pleurochrysis_carterae.AAC.1
MGARDRIRSRWSQGSKRHVALPWRVRPRLGLRSLRRRANAGAGRDSRNDARVQRVAETKLSHVMSRTRACRVRALRAARRKRRRRFRQQRRVRRRR